MKALTKCDNVVVGRISSARDVQLFRTAWCDLLGGCSNTRDILHFYYKFEWLQNEIEKRSSYLGKFRRTEEAQHLLDLIAMTRDELDLFYPFAKEAMADVFDAIHQYTPEIPKAYLFDEGHFTISFPSFPLITAEVVKDSEKLFSLYNLSKEDSLGILKRAKTHDVLLESEDYNQAENIYVYAFTTDENEYFYSLTEELAEDAALYAKEDVDDALSHTMGESRVAILKAKEVDHIAKSVSNGVVWDGDTIKGDVVLQLNTDDEVNEDLNVVVTLDIDYTADANFKNNNQAAELNNQYTEQVEFVFTSKDFTDATFLQNFVVKASDLAPAGEVLTAEHIISIDDLRVSNVELTFLHPQTYKEGDWLIDGDGNLYKALVDGDTNDLTSTEAQAYDFRHSIHYVMHKPRLLNDNMVEPIDTAIFEALVNRILQRWLQLSYPAEAEQYEKQYLEALAKLKKRLSSGKCLIVRRIPRVF